MPHRGADTKAEIDLMAELESSGDSFTHVPGDWIETIKLKYDLSVLT